MGMKKPGSHCGCSGNTGCYCGDNSSPINVTINNETVAPGNPDPKNFTIVETDHWLGTRIIVAKINYPDCTNYEGDKILVFDDLSYDELYTLQTIDPHFCDKGHPSPIARFKPTKEGWKNALRFALTLVQRGKLWKLQRLLFRQK
jgi:hypothetical protein